MNLEKFSFDTLTNKQIRALFAVNSFDPKYTNSLANAGVNTSKVLATSFESKEMKTEIYFPLHLKIICDFDRSKYFKHSMWSHTEDFDGSYRELHTFLFYDNGKVRAHVYRIIGYMHDSEQNPAVMSRVQAKDCEYSIADAMRKFGLSVMREVADVCGWDEMIRNVDLE